MTIRVFEAFAGVGSQRMALRNLGIDHEVVAISDVDEFTVKSYAAIHDDDKTVPQVTDDEMQDYLEERNIPLNDKGVRKILKGKKLKEFYDACIKSNNLGDISKVVTQDIPDHDLFTYSFPCQDISVAGKGLGLNEGSDTRSGLLWECQKVIDAKRPKYLLLENVKNLVGKKHRHNFDKWLEWLEEQGYTNYWQVLNAKDYGIPQNRERVFVVSILGEHEPYIFPNKETLILRLKDVLEDEVDEKYYLNNEKAKQLVATITEENNITNPTVVDSTINEPKTKEIMNAITARYDAGIQNYKSIGGAVIEPKIKQVGNTTPNPKRENPQTGRTYGIDGLAPTLNTMQGGNRQPQIIEPKIAASRGRNPENPSDRTVGGPTEQRLEINKQGTSNTITTVQKDNYVIEPDKIKRFINDNYKDTGSVTELPKVFQAVGDRGNHSYSVKDISNTIPANAMSDRGQQIIEPSFRIRKLTPLECWRLMGFSDDDFHKAEEVNSNTQLYKQAGNSIVVPVLEAIFKQLFKEESE